MKVRVLGCSGAIARGCRTTSFLIDHDTLIDAGTGVGDLTCDEMLGIENVFLTHSHLDHIACLPLMVDTIAARHPPRPLRVHALPETIAALRQHIFNGVIWPDFSRLPTSDTPFVTFHAIEVGRAIHTQGRTIEPLPAAHSVPAVGYAARGGPDAPWWVFSGDTERNPAFWSRVNQLAVGALVIETAFSNREREIARLSRHLSPDALAQELDLIGAAQRYPIFITHTKPAETETIMREIACFDRPHAPVHAQPHDIRWLSAGHVFEL